MAYKFQQGVFRPQNPKKYTGDITKIYYRSSLELSFMMILDKSPTVLEWVSEETVIPYTHPLERNQKGFPRFARYFVDFKIKVRKDDGKIVTQLIEIKPLAQTKAPKVEGTRKKKKTILTEQRNWIINTAKWDAARNYCERKGYEFHIITEQDLGLGKAKWEHS